MTVNPVRNKPPQGSCRHSGGGWISNGVNNRLGFKIEKILKLNGWKVMELTDKISMEKQINCPCSGHRLETICSIVSENTPQKIDIGCCAACGYVGYIDRPSQEWMVNFYSTTWDQSGAKLPHLTKRSQPEKNRVLQMVKRLPLEKNSPICEIGCGYGGTLAELRQMGFKNIMGIENSKHRAEIASQQRNLKVVYGNFEGEEVQRQLKTTAPFRLIFSAHVLEHVYDPAEFVEKASQLQKDGDYLILSLPNSEGEPAMAVLMFLPHLSSFTPEAIRQLLKKHSYEVIDTSLTNQREINIVAKKSEKVGPRTENQPDYFSAALEKFKKELALENYPAATFRRLWWIKKDAGQSGQMKYYRQPIWEWINFAIHSLSLPLKGCHSVMIQNPAGHLTDAPIEIQFRGNIKLFYK